MYSDLDSLTIFILGGYSVLRLGLSDNVHWGGYSVLRLGLSDNFNWGEGEGGILQNRGKL